MNWSSLAYWQKGGIIGSLSYFVIGGVSYGLASACDAGWECFGYIIPLLPAFVIKELIVDPFITVGEESLLFPTLLLIFTTGIGFGIGMFISFTYKEIKEKIKEIKS